MWFHNNDFSEFVVPVLTDLSDISGGSHSHQKQPRAEQHDEDDERSETNHIVQNIINTEATLNEKLEKSQLKLFSSSTAISSEVSKILTTVYF